MCSGEAHTKNVCTLYMYVYLHMSFICRAGNLAAGPRCMSTLLKELTPGLEYASNTAYLHYARYGLVANPQPRFANGGRYLFDKLCKSVPSVPRRPMPDPGEGGMFENDWQLLVTLHNTSSTYMNTTTRCACIPTVAKCHVSPLYCSCT
jgi:hypothetical protein